MFVGVDLPSAVKDELSSISERLRGVIEHGRWVPRENLHVTVQFLGNVDEALVSSIASAIGTAVTGLVDVPVHLQDLGAFPTPRRARVVWAGLADPAGGLPALAGVIGDGLTRLGFEPDTRPFRSHVTLARLDPPRPVTLTLAPAPLRFDVDRATLFRSHLSSGGARYEVLAVFPFRRPPEPPRGD